MTTTNHIAKELFKDSKRLEGRELEILNKTLRESMSDEPTSFDDTGSRIIRKLPKIRVKGIINKAK